ncbi:NADH-quinone oxidoreductase subunit J family protein [Pelagicoccus albus]|uniref:NADH-quinone oxidoreductase subunit J n=1 Tax=Pelagicoccus albus TaxID=415222 RepID=A0A7X1B5L5_9BACT|nr:NADH-quinone oxidoreductase subunit J [Pelagicoccus albus]MBC2605957.1 NADH-quinone oxidoreductase subunit J [Pelagicoccus albus]
MTDLFFYIFATLSLGAAFGVVFSRNPVNAAMYLILTFLGMASLFVTLEAYFLAVIQVLVYAGAVVVLFLFIIMLLDVKDETQHRVKPLTWVASVIGFALLIVGIVSISSSDNIKATASTLPDAAGASLKNFGYELFTTYQLPMQVTGFLLLIAMIGVIVLSKKVKTD